jgi:hypothetical protein
VFRELKLQQDRLARRKEQQQRAEQDNADFLAQIGEPILKVKRRYTVTNLKIGERTCSFSCLFYMVILQ